MNSQAGRIEKRGTPCNVSKVGGALGELIHMSSVFSFLVRKQSSLLLLSSDALVPRVFAAHAQETLHNSLQHLISGVALKARKTNCLGR